MHDIQIKGYQPNSNKKVALFPGLPCFDLQAYCIHNNTRIRKIGEKLKPWSSAPMYYCERKQKVKAGEAWEQG